MPSANSYLSVMDLELYDEPLPPDFDPTADANAEREIIPADRYEVRVVFSAQEPWLRWEPKVAKYGPARAFLSTCLACTITSGPYAKRRLFAQVSTIRRHSGRSSVEELLSALGISIHGRRTQSIQKRLLTQALEQPRSCIAVIEWRAWDSDAGLERELRWFDRMDHFPLDADGNFISEVEMSDGTIITAHNYVRCWETLASETQTL